MKLTLYLLFDGACKPAMEFYQSCFGGELKLTTVGSSPMRNVTPQNMHNKILNARLQSATVDISASDWLRPDETPICGNMVCLYVSEGTQSEIERIFTRLSDQANVTDPLKEMPIGVYGALNDRYGVRWMFHAAKA